MPETPSDVFCGDCGRLMLYHPACEQFICVVCHDDKTDQKFFELEPYTGSDGL